MNAITGLHKNLHDLIINLGGSFVGFSNVFEMLPTQLKRYPYAITFGIRLSDAIIDDMEDKPTFTYFNHYRSVNTLIDLIELRIMLFIQNNGYRAYTIPASQSIPDAPEPYSGLFPHKTGAVASGLGWIGKNSLFIHKDFGPRVRLGTVLTDLELPCRELKSISPGEKTDQEIIQEFGIDPELIELERVLTNLQKVCRSCNRCVSFCPAMALTGKEWRPGIKREEIVDAKACSDYMRDNFKHIGRGSVCGICIKVCPLGNFRNH